MKVIYAVMLFAAISLASCSHDHKPKAKDPDPKRNEIVSLIRAKGYDLAEYYSVDVIPDSLRAARRVYVIELVRAASSHMTGGDYEDPEDVIEQAEQTANRMFKIKEEGIRYLNTKFRYERLVEKSELAHDDSIVFKWLKEKGNVEDTLNSR